MDYEESKELYDKQHYIVSKSNTIVQKSRYELSVPEQRAIAYICSMIKPVDALDRAKGNPFQLEYEFDILEYAKTCDISADNGRIYEETKALLKSLITKVMWLTLEDGTETTVNWINKVWTNKRSGKARIRLDEDITPYLFDLQEKFTSYGLYNILKMKSQYSIRLFEILKSYEWQKSKTFDVDELKRLLMVEKNKSYENFAEFKRRVLIPALDEINEYTDLEVSMYNITKGRKIVKVKFDIVDVLKEEKIKNKFLFEQKIKFLNRQK